MMRIAICDICYNESTKMPRTVVQATYTVSRKTKTESIKLDACDKHKDFFKDTNSLEEARKKVYALYDSKVVMTPDGQPVQDVPDGT